MAHRWIADHGIRIERIPTETRGGQRHQVAAMLATAEIEHFKTHPYRPQANVTSRRAATETPTRAVSAPCGS